MCVCVYIYIYIYIYVYVYDVPIHTQSERERVRVYSQQRIRKNKNKEQCAERRTPGYINGCKTVSKYEEAETEMEMERNKILIRNEKDDSVRLKQLAIHINQSFNVTLNDIHLKAMF